MRFAPQVAYAARCARSRRTEQNTNEADREVYNFWCKPTTCKCQELHARGHQPGRRMHVPGTKSSYEKSEEIQEGSPKNHFVVGNFVGNCRLRRAERRENIPRVFSEVSEI